MATVIFDFDGTIADSLDVVIGVYRELTGDKRELTHEEFQALRRLPAQKVIRVLGIPMWRVPSLLLKGRKLMHSELSSVGVFEGLPAVLQQLHQDGHQLYVLSSNSTENVSTFLRRHGLLHYFTSVRGGAGLFTKSSAIRQVIRSHRLDKQAVIYVGDEARDIVSAKKAHVPIISVTWGYNDAELLASMSPTFVVNTPQELAEAVGEADKKQLR